MKLICKYCKCEITTEVWFKMNGKTERILTCMICFSNYLKIMHQADIEFGNCIDKNDERYYPNDE